MDLKDQLKDLFPDHEPQEEEKTASKSDKLNIWLQSDPLICEFSKRKGKANTLIKGYSGAKKDFQNLTKYLKKEIGVGGSHKNEEIIIQGDYREQIMSLLKDLGFNVKRVGG
ncbi:translation initiation factor [Psychroflexus sediminis]|uniref:Translation initiation factor 1 (eIF-1/SUI1) n=1 Tax=Psychroflexus sediminis TaxID=470826 RepID=A0A1G7YXB6_9FLAO|nr:translation initiation factor [Psychroflexus sediminis]SDH01212.1 translation initiation factor 1 (eIF-1/SUI1) [Psychroflexus sediminis]